ncbi:collagenase [Ferrimonas balearica]|uniref:collagenase n=1 Tax=Ferrimonas balearica TaxID=44012 RepID=UPI001C999A4E|nr:collagenase [Ferrimonas balearica]MBY5923497.1 collagenase [Ferrimonas balearica]MBY5997876.1 collagenase [Ferrimonas balearica]
MRLLLPLALTGLLGACSSLPEPAPIPLQNWQQPDPEQLPLALDNLSHGDAEPALDYLRAFSYFGDPDTLTEAQQVQLHEAMLARGKRLNALTEPRLAEQWAVTLYRYYGQEGLQDKAEALLPSLIRQLELFSEHPPVSLAQEYALWELLRAPGLLMHKVRRDDESNPLRQTLSAQGISEALRQYAASSGARYDSQDWPLQNAYWVLAHQRLLLEEEAALAQDEAVAAIARQDQQHHGDSAKTAFTLGYLVNAFLGQEACKETYGDLCAIPEPEAVLPITHACTDRLVIRTQDLSRDELAVSCERLTSQEDHFHQLLATGMTPVVNDHNTALEVVVFKNWSQYNAYGQLLFDIGTDNGGMYIEGTPQAEGNQARFFAFRGWWLPEFNVWNLNHEYVHYLDGRYIKYGGFGHFPGQMVWWAEGLAEYISKGNDNRQAQKLLQETAPAEWPTLETIFATEYDDGLDRTYRWSYMAVRYLSEHDPERLRSITQPLKGDYAEGYANALAETAGAHQAGFEQWLTQWAAEPLAEEENASPYPRKLNRYGYRDYLRPPQLANTEGHLHF